AGAELDRQGNRTLLRELIAVQAQREPRVSARRQVAAGLVDVERSALEEHVRGFGELSGGREHLGQGEVEICVLSLELGWDRVGPEPGRHSTFAADRAQRRKLRLAVEPVA